MAFFLVTGGAGFIGSNLCESLLEDGHRVRVLDNLSFGKEENIRGLAGSIEFIKGDIRDARAAREAVKGTEYVIHLAAMGSVPKSVEDPATTHDVNVTGTLNMLIASRDAGVKRLVFASSSAIYGDDPELPKTEAMTPAPLSPYAVSKLSGEYYCKVFLKAYGFETVCLRYFNVFGKRQDPNSQYAAVIPKFVDALLRNERPVIYGDGEQTRDFVFVDDCNQANIKACTAPGAAGGSYNIGCGYKVTVNDLLREITAKMGKKLKPLYSEVRKGDIKDSLASIDAARDKIGFSPVFSLSEGMERTVRWYLAHSKAA